MFFGMLFLMLFFTIENCLAAVNREIDYRGKLTYSGGNIVTDGTYDMRFRIYDSLTDGILLWTGIHTESNGNPIAVNDGIFSVLLGSGTGNTLSLDFSTNSYYLEVSIYNSETPAWEDFSPRKQIASVPQAYNANSIIGDGNISLNNTSASQGAAIITYNPASGTNNALEITYGSGGGSGTALQVTQSGDGDILRLYDDSNQVFTVLDGGNVGIGTTNPSELFTVNAGSSNAATILTNDGNIIMGPNAYPNRAGSTDSGGINIYGGGSIKSGLFTEVNGNLLSYGINSSQQGDRDANTIGAIFRLDTRAGSPYWSLKRQPVGGSSEYSDFQISSVGDVGFGSGHNNDTNSFLGQMHIFTRSADVPVLVLQGQSSQTANLTEWRTGSAGSAMLLGSVDANGNFSIGSDEAPTDRVNIAQSTSSNGVDGVQIELVTVGDADDIDNAGLRINVTSGNSGEDNSLEGIMVGNITGQADTLESALKIGTGWDRDFIFSNADAVWEFVDNTTLSWTNGENNTFLFRDLSANFGASMETGAMISRNSYIAEEFTRERANITSSGRLNWGDNTQLGTVETNSCTFSILDDTPNGIHRQETSATNSGCRIYHSGSTLGTDPSLIFDADNLPVILMKVRPSNVGTNDRIRVGLADDYVSTNTDPSNGIYFTNDASTGNWQGVTRSGGNSTTYSCPSAIQTGTSQFALLKIEVRSANDVNFFVDNDVSNGIEWETCTGATGNVPTVALTSMLKNYSTTSGRILDVDFFRAWQDDTKIPAILAGDVDPSEIVTEQEIIDTASDTFTAKESITTPKLFAGVIEADLVKAKKIEGMEFVETRFDETDQGIKNIGNAIEELEKEILSLKNLANSNEPNKSEMLDVKYVEKLIAEGGITVSGPVDFQGPAVFKSLAEFFDKVIFNKDVDFKGKVVADGGIVLGRSISRDTDSSGYAVIKKGERAVEIRFENQYEEPPIITANLMQKKIDDDELAEASSDLLLFSDIKFIIAKVDKKGFFIKIDQPAITDIEFSWNAAAVENAKTFEENSDPYGSDRASDKEKDEDEDEEVVLKPEGGSEEIQNTSDSPDSSLEASGALIDSD